jgi:acetyl esterase/lipase
VPLSLDTNWQKEGHWAEVDGTEAKGRENQCSQRHSELSYDSLCRDLALQTSCAVVLPLYSLAPETKFPTQQEECFAVLKQIAKDGKRRRLRVAGDSAGGLTAAALIKSLRRAHSLIPPNQVNSPLP